MTPVRKAAARLGWVGFGCTMACCFVIIVASPGWPMFIGVMLWGVTIVSAEPALYRWVTAPEREGNEDPLT